MNCLSIVLALTALVEAAPLTITPVADSPFIQEYHEAYPLTPEMGDTLRTIAVDREDTVWTGTGTGIFFLRDGQWKAVDGDAAGSTYTIVPASDGAVWAGAWNGLYRIADGIAAKVPEINDPLSAIVLVDENLFAFGPRQSWNNRGGAWSPLANRWAGGVTSAITDGAGGILLTTGLALYWWQADDSVTAVYTADQLITAELYGATQDQEGRFWFGGLGGITVFDGTDPLWRFPGHRRLPNGEITCLATAPDGTVWAGSALGAMRWIGDRWSLRHGRRWLLSDDVKSIAFDSRNTAWIATQGGVSAIKQRTMTLAEKAKETYAKTMARHVRPPYIVEQCRLETPGDLASWVPEDDDNDGGYTCVYMVMESFRYAATGDPDALKKARKAFETSLFLREITETEGFIARTVIPADWTRMHDGNETVSAEVLADRHVEDPRWKQVDVRWRRSADGKWLWKGDTSSDEIVAHYWGAYMYYELAADDEEKIRVRDHVKRMTDYILDGGLVLRDIDGGHTRWGVWAPSFLNGDPNWLNEAPINSTEILSFLQVAHHMTGDKQYADAILDLVNSFGYGERTRNPFIAHPSGASHIDTELLAMVWPGLIQCALSPELEAMYREGLDRWMDNTRLERSPYFNFTYGSLADNRDILVEDCVKFLRQCPLDLRHWTMDNTRREDVDLVRSPLTSPLQTHVLLPPDERNIMRWDKNPWMAIDGNGAHTESSGVYWLLPYWMGRYYGFIAPPAEALPAP